ncbi:MAG: hypothetical protein ACKOUK_00925 [Verrucomicrobiota bacterium]
MNADLQSKLAVAIVAGAVAGLLVAWLRRRRRAGCGGECGCATKPAKVGGGRGRR